MKIRAAEARDVPALVRLRLANAQRHAELGPTVHRLPDPALVRDHFAERLKHGPDPLILVAEAEAGGDVAGTDSEMAEGGGEVAAAEATAREHGVTTLHAVIYAPNEDAADFYTTAGFGPHGIILAKDLEPE